MPTDALLAVLVGAVLHASWNTAIKSGADKRLDTVLVAGGSALIAALVLPALPLPSAASLPYILASTLLQIVYYRLVAASYRAGSMSHAYPLMRGTAPLIVAAASGVLLGEHLSPAGWAGTLLVCGGVLALALGGQRSPERSRATGFALANAVVIAGYTLVDGVGVRLSDHAGAYALWVFLLTAPPMIAWTAWTRPREACGPRPRALGLWFGRRRLRHGILRVGPVGDDAGAHRHGGGAARNLHPVRSGPGRAGAEGDHRPGPHRRRNRHHAGRRHLAAARLSDQSAEAAASMAAMAAFNRRSCS